MLRIGWAKDRNLNDPICAYHLATPIIVAARRDSSVPLRIAIASVTLSTEFEEADLRSGLHHAAQTVSVSDGPFLRQVPNLASTVPSLCPS